MPVLQRSALITGASSGIGLGLARMLADEGYALTLVARREDRLAAAAASLAATGAVVDVLAGDLRDEATVRAAAVVHRDRHGRLDLLVNNAGVGLGQDVAALSTSKVDVQIALDLRSPILLHRECADLLFAAAAARGWSQVVNIASAAGRNGQPWLSVYSAAKGGLIAFTHAMNRELASVPVLCTAVIPGTVDTELTQHFAVARDRLIPVEAVVEAVRTVLRVAPRCRVPELVLEPLRELSEDEMMPTGGAATGRGR